MFCQTSTPVIGPRTHGKGMKVNENKPPPKAAKANVRAKSAQELFGVISQRSHKNGGFFV